MRFLTQKRTVLLDRWQLCRVDVQKKCRITTRATRRVVLTMIKRAGGATRIVIAIDSKMDIILQ